MSTWHVTFTGRVQGVGFRQSCSQKADHLQLTGWVRNMTDGSVEATVQGTPDALEAWVKSCKSDILFASVQSAIKQDVPNSEIYTTFNILF